MVPSCFFKIAMRIKINIIGLNTAKIINNMSKNPVPDKPCNAPNGNKLRSNPITTIAINILLNTVVYLLLCITLYKNNN